MYRPVPLPVIEAAVAGLESGVVGGEQGVGVGEVHVPNAVSRMTSLRQGRGYVSTKRKTVHVCAGSDCQVIVSEMPADRRTSHKPEMARKPITTA